jgi:hypothetical protein
MKSRIVQFILLAVAVAGIFPAAVASDYYAADLNGDDASSPGSLEAPFKTISKAAAVMVPGDRCFIREGIYRETVTVSQNQLYFGAYSNEHVVVSGCDLVAGSWSVYAGSIMKAAVTNKVLQLFANGQRMNLARYPNEDANQDMLSDDEWEATETVGLSTAGTGLAKVTFSTMNQPTGHWVGGYYTGQNGSDPFTAAVGQIISSSGSSININELAYYSRLKTNAVSGIGSGVGYIINHINALDIAGEWYWNNGLLYLYPEAGTDLTNNAVVEARFRLLGFVLDSKSDVVLENIHFHAASISMADATNCLVDGCSVRYPAPWSNYSYPNGHDYGGRADGSVGLYISGTGNVLTNSYIARSWGSGIRVEGVANALNNCVIEDIDWCGRRMAGVQLLGVSNRVERCTIRNCGRDGIDGGQRRIGFEQWGTWQVMRNNRIEHTGWLATDSGGFYINLQGALPAHCEFAYNEVFYNHGGLYASGIFLDNGTHTARIHHNLLVGPQQWGLVLNDGKLEVTDNVLVANNTIWEMDSWGLRVATSTPSYNPTNICVVNNLSCSGFLLYTGTIQSSNSSAMPETEFEDVKGNDFRLVAGSQYIDAGVVIPGITDGYTGSAPDCGAYEDGVVWTAGSSLPVPPEYMEVDTDADTVPDITELIFGTDPLNAETFGNRVSDGEIYRTAGQVVVNPVKIAATNIVLEFDSKANWYHYCEWTDSLASNIWKTVSGTGISGMGDNRSMAFDPDEGSSGFVRISSSLIQSGLKPVFRDGFDNYSPEPANGVLFSGVNTLWTGSTLVRLYDSNVTAVPADSGQYYVQFIGETGGGTIFCTIETEIGQNYILGVALARVTSNGFPNLDVQITGSASRRISATLLPGEWQYIVIRFTAVGRETGIAFSEPGTNSVGQAPILDSICVSKGS